MPKNTPPTDINLQWGAFDNRALHKAACTAALVKRWVAHACQGAAEITVRIVGEDEARALNKQFRQKDYATNILTFDYATEPVVCADLVLCGPVVAREAAEQGKLLQDHYAHLLIHGTLHAQGYDHETNERDALEMEALEILLMGALELPCPY